MIQVTISYNVTEETYQKLDNLQTDIQLALYDYDLYKNKKDKILSKLEDNPKIRIVHLPLQTLKIPVTEIDELINDIFIRTGCVNFVVHPNRGIEKFLRYFQKKSPQIICVETFAWRRKKALRTPLEIIDVCRWYNSAYMTIDTCHIEDIWFDHKIMSYLLKYTKVIHLSNRAKGFGSHIPFNHPHGELKLVSFVRELKFKYKWSGYIVLEYMAEYQDKLLKNYNYVKRLLEIE